MSISGNRLVRLRTGMHRVREAAGATMVARGCPKRRAVRLEPPWRGKDGRRRAEGRRRHMFGNQNRAVVRGNW
jgi:hypothetical protein